MGVSTLISRRSEALGSWDGDERRKQMVKAQPLVKLTSRILGLCDDAEKEEKKKKDPHTLGESAAF